MESTAAILKKMNEMWILLEQANNDIGVYDEDFVRKRIEWKKMYARTFMSESGSMDLRRQQATLDCIDAELDMDLAEMRVRTCKERIRMLGQQLEILRSMNAAAQRQFMTEPIGQYT
jgi:hypothetical protein